jgi:acyl-CoA hydrolase
MQVVPVHFGALPALIRAGRLRCDVAMVQVSPAGPDGKHSFGAATDYIVDATAVARLVIAEINDQVPWTMGGHTLDPARIAVAVHTSRPLLQVPSVQPTPLDAALGRHAAAHIPDGAVLQVGIGRLADAVLAQLRGHRELGIHSGLINDALLDLIECGAVTNARKGADAGVSVAGSLFGTDRLYRFAHRNGAVQLRTADYTHGTPVLAQIERFVSINGALEVDLTGQVGAEETGGIYLGAVGGQPDFVRAGHRSPGGCSLITLPATAARGNTSRICAALGGPVTTPRSDVDIVVTEFGAADLRGQTIAERARRLVSIADPRFQPELAKHAATLAQRGF